jgi:hypothetical protein
MKVTFVPDAPTARSVYGVHAVAFAFGNETVRAPALVAVARACPVNPTPNVNVTRSRDLNPVPRIVSGFSFTTFSVALVAT